jgi:hypothetical protein
MHRKALWPLTKWANRGFRGYPVAFYGPDDRRASKVAVGILPKDGAEASDLERGSRPRATFEMIWPFARPC